MNSNRQISRDKQTSVFFCSLAGDRYYRKYHLRRIIADNKAR